MENMKRVFKSIPIAITVLLFATTPALFGQHKSRDISGSVTDRHHEPLRGAVVQAHNLSTLTVVSYITGTDGRYSFRHLSGDCDFKISASWHNQHSTSKNLSLFDTSQPRVINLTIKGNGQ